MTPGIRDEILTVKEVCKILKESRTGLFRLRKGGKIRAKRQGHKVVFLVSDVNEYMATLPAADAE